jgi:hypothetical protein
MVTREDVRNHTPAYRQYQRENNHRFNQRHHDRIITDRRAKRRSLGMEVKGSPEWIAFSRIRLTAQNPFYWADYWMPLRTHIGRPRWCPKSEQSIFNEKSLLILDGQICEVPNCQNIAKQVDHDHRTGRIRGAICPSHNLAIGFLEKHRVDPLLEYLGKYQ